MLGYLIAFLFGFSLSFLVFRLTHRRVIKRMNAEMQRLKEQHRKEWQELIYRLNHTGPIPQGSSASGLTDLISWAIKVSIDLLETLLENKDWNTISAIKQLKGIAMVELIMLRNKLNDMLNSQRNFLRDYNHKQEEDDSKTVR